MSKIKLTLPEGSTPVTGKQVTFTAPCDSNAADYITINNVDYELLDSMNQKPTKAWVSGSLVTVTLDCTNNKAYIQRGSGAISQSELKDIIGYDDRMYQVIPDTRKLIAYDVLGTKDYKLITDSYLINFTTSSDYMCTIDIYDKVSKNLVKTLSVSISRFSSNLNYLYVSAFDCTDDILTMELSASTRDILLININNGLVYRHTYTSGGYYVSSTYAGTKDGYAFIVNNDYLTVINLETMTKDKSLSRSMYSEGENVYGNGYCHRLYVVNGNINYRKICYYPLSEYPIHLQSGVSAWFLWIDEETNESYIFIKNDSSSTSMYTFAKYNYETKVYTPIKSDCESYIFLNYLGHIDDNTCLIEAKLINTNYEYVAKIDINTGNIIAMCNESISSFGFYKKYKVNIPLLYNMAIIDHSNRFVNVNNMTTKYVYMATTSVNNTNITTSYSSNLMIGPKNCIYASNESCYYGRLYLWSSNSYKYYGPANPKDFIGYQPLTIMEVNI